MEEYTVKGAFKGWKNRDTLVEMTNGRVFRQNEYHYEYFYAYRPMARFDGERMQVEGSDTWVAVKRLK